MALWMMVVAAHIALHNLIPSSQVVMRQPKGDSHHPTHATCEKGISHLTRRHSSARFSYIPALGGSGMQISPPDTVIKQLLGLVLRQGWREGNSSKRPKAENSIRIRPIDGSKASFLMRLGRILSPSCSQAY